MQNYLKLLSFLKGYKRLFSFAVFAMLIASAFRVFEISMLVPLVDRIFNNRQIVLPNHVPSFLANIVARINQINPETLLEFLPLVVLIGMLIKHGATYFSGYLMNDISLRIMRDVRERLYVKIQNLSLDYFSKKRTGELMSRITYDVPAIENAVSYGVTDLFVQTFSIIGFIATAFIIHFKAAVIIFCTFPFIIIPITRIGRLLRKLLKRSQERMADINSILLETITGVKVVKAFGNEDFERRKFQAKNQEFYKLRLKSIKRSLLTEPITEIFGVICGIAIIWWMGRQVLHHELSMGVFILFFASIMSVINPAKRLGNVNALAQQALAANERIYEVLDAEITVKENPHSRVLPRIREAIRFENVGFFYQKNDSQVLQGIDLTIAAGELVAIVGPTGAGKTSLVNLIPRFYDPTSGCVRIDGVDLRDITFASLRQQMSIVTQDPFLFNDTVEANIAYGVLNPPFEKVEDAARRAYAQRFIMSMPQQYQTVIGERGFRLSGGEKQRLTIARAIYRNPAILILDEATSQLDSESEKYVQEALDELMTGRTTIAIAHRLSTIKKADKIVVLEHGKIVGIGKHLELLENCALYKRLYETQFQM